MNKLTKVIICGSRQYTDWYSFYLKIKPIFEESDKNTIEIVSNGRIGPGLLALDFAHIEHIPLKIANTDWSQYGKSAVYRCNADMMRHCLDVKDRRLIVFYHDETPEINHIINICKLHDFKISLFPV